MASFLTTWVPLLCTATMMVLLLVLLIRYFAAPFYPQLTFVQLVKRWRGQPVGAIGQDTGSDASRSLKRMLRKKWFGWRSVVKLLGWISLMWLLSRLLILATAFAGAWLTGQLDVFLDHFASRWVQWDANHYLGLAENWYVNEGDPRYHIVFYPLYPLIVRSLRWLFAGNTLLTAVVVSNLAFIASALLIYFIVLDAQGIPAARRSVRYLMFCPLSLFFSIPYSESVFLLTCVLAVFLARKKYFGFAVGVGALAAASRSLGVLIAAPVYLEMLKHVRSLKLWPQRKGRCTLRIAIYTLMTCLILLGLVYYIMLNWKVTGEPFKFLEYQRDHWSQEFGSMANTLRYTIRNAVEYHSWEYRVATWIPQAVLIVAFVALLGITVNRVHPGDGAFAWLYLFAATAPTWLLSGPRYLFAMYALYPMLTLITRKKWQDGLMMTAFLLGLVFFTYQYAIVGYVL